jgi:RNA polymerase sigma-70 factor (ECF subfamily)
VVSGENDHLTAALARGDRGALERLYRTFKDDLLSAAYHLLGDLASAEDVLQDVFVGLAKNGRRLDPARRLRPYLVAACLNRARDLMRRRRRGPSLLEGLDERGSGNPGPFETAGRRDEARAVADALAGIPAEQREVVVLRVYGQLRFREIAEVLEVSINTVQSRHRYALAALRERLAEAGAAR